VEKWTTTCISSNFSFLYSVLEQYVDSNPSDGFFLLFSDNISLQQIEEKANTLIIYVVEGDVNARNIEKEFNEGGVLDLGGDAQLDP
jgi:sulfur transfer complex TusBCD TusB component (DsrH family)